MLCVGSIIILFMILGVNPVGLTRIRQNNEYSDNFKLFGTIIKFVQQSLLVVYAYFNINNVKLKTYVLVLLRGLQKVNTYNKSSKFIVKSWCRRKQRKSTSASDSLMVSAIEDPEVICDTSVNESSSYDLKNPHLDNSNSYKKNFALLKRNA